MLFSGRSHGRHILSFTAGPNPPDCDLLSRSSSQSEEEVDYVSKGLLWSRENPVTAASTLSVFSVAFSFSPIRIRRLHSPFKNSPRPVNGLRSFVVRFLLLFFSFFLFFLFSDIESWDATMGRSNGTRVPFGAVQSRIPQP